MPDIAMCKGDGCPLKEKCYRHTAKPSRYQSWLVESPWNGFLCDFYWAIRKEAPATEKRETGEKPG